MQELIEKPQPITRRKRQPHPYNVAFMKMKGRAEITMEVVLWWLRLWADDCCRLYCTRHEETYSLRWICKPTENQLSFETEKVIDADVLETWWGGKTIPIGETVRLNVVFAIIDNKG